MPNLDQIMLLKKKKCACVQQFSLCSAGGRAGVKVMDVIRGVFTPSVNGLPTRSEGGVVGEKHRFLYFFSILGNWNHH